VSENFFIRQDKTNDNYTKDKTMMGKLRAGMKRIINSKNDTQISETAKLLFLKPKEAQKKGETFTTTSHGETLKVKNLKPEGIPNCHNVTQINRIYKPCRNEKSMRTSFAQWLNERLRFELTNGREKDNEDKFVP